jgi:hypothetical protein
MKHGENRRSVSSKAFVVMLALVLALGCAVGGTIAWLTAQTGKVTNTFTYGNINIDLTETVPENRQAKIIPSQDIPKDPKVTVKANSETCYLFVKVEATGDFANGKVAYSVDTTEGNWTALTGVPGVYWREVENSTANQDFYVLAGNKVTVSENLTKGEIENLTGPTLTFTAYAIQKEGTGDAAAAWAKIGA